jgi:signal transduction histidine kinase
MIDAHLILSEHPDTLADLDGKIVIFGRSLNESNLTFNTSLGAYSKLGISGIIASNFVSQSWIKIASPLTYLSYFALLGCAIIWLISRYPHKVALILLVFLGLVLTLLSVYLFDTQNIWLPITGVWVQITTTWVLFLGYSLNRMEQSSLKLREEKKLHQQLEELKINFVSLISHDLKTPIAKIQAVTSRLRTLPCSTEIQDDLTKIDKYSKELHRYIQNVLKLLQVETSKFKLNIDSVDLNLLIHEIVTELQSVAQEKQVSISLDLAPLFPIDGDYQLIKEIFLNLIQNAIQYSNPQTQVKIIVVEQDHFIKVRITDQGMGIPSEELPFLFHKFYRGKNSSINQQGSGLGLYLVKYFIELHNGKIHIESVLNNGTTVTVWLPIEQKIDLPENQHDSEDDHDS